MAYVNALELKWKHLQKGDKFTVHSLDLNISSEDEVTTVSGKEFQSLIIRTGGSEVMAWCRHWT